MRYSSTSCFAAHARLRANPYRLIIGLHRDVTIHPIESVDSKNKCLKGALCALGEVMMVEQAGRRTFLEWMDSWMAENPWNPRIAPFAVYIVFLFISDQLAEHIDPRTVPLTYAIQCGLVLWLLWRYRKLLPELTLSFHWLAIPVGVGVLIAWILVGWAMAGEFGMRWDALVERGEFLGRIDYTALNREAPWLAVEEPHRLETMLKTSKDIAWTTLILRLLGMSLVVPLFEELFIRSLMLRSLHTWRLTKIGLMQLAQDMPAVGDWIDGSSKADKIDRYPPIFGRQFLATPLGQLSVFGVAASTFIFTVNHAVRDYPGCILCGIAYCLILAATRRRGLGPVCWAHGITNALLWWYTIATGDWQFL